MLEGMAAASLEAIEDLTQVLFHMLSDKEDAMKVVWHELESYDSYFRIIAWDAIPFISYRLPQRRGHSPWGLLVAEGLAGIANDSAENGLAPFGCHRYHVHPPRLVVVVLLAACH